MTNRKKKKTPPKQPTDHGITKSYFDQFSVTARKVLQVMELDPALYDEFTKKQKHEMMLVKFVPPKVHVKPGSSIPQRHIKTVQQELYEFLKHVFVGDESIGLSYFDFSTRGMAFITGLIGIGNKNNDICQSERYILIDEKIEMYVNNLEFEKNLMTKFCRYIQYILGGISKLNFRIYGFEWTWQQVANSTCLAGDVLLTVTKQESLNFLYKGMNRPAYRVSMGEFFSDIPVHLCAPFNKIITTSNCSNRIDFYIQNHALNRLKERLDTISSFNRNVYLMSSLMVCDTLKLETGKFVIKFHNLDGRLLGYLPFTIINQNLLILTFIPLSSPIMPEGKLLCEALNVEKDDIVFLGMDKLSFYQNTDFETIPHLLEALKKANMWHLTEVKPEENFDKLIYGQNSNRINHFFQQNAPEPNKEEVLDEIEKLY
jgi:hypothetical protein